MANTFTIAGTLKDPENNALASAYIRFRVTSVGTDLEDNVTYPRRTVEFQTDGSGDFTGTLWINGDSGIECYYEITLPDGQRVDVVIPSSAEGTTLRLEDIIELYQVNSSTQQSNILATALDRTNHTGGPDDLDGNEIILDADGDTSITADTDDQIDFRIGGVDELTLTAAKADNLDDIAAHTPTDSNFLVGDGTNWVLETGETALTSIGAITGTGGGNIGTSASATTGGAMGNTAVATTGAAVGVNTTATSGFAGGATATTTTGAAIGNLSSSTSGAAIGDSATTTTGVAIGGSASALLAGTAIGAAASSTGGGIALGAAASETGGGSSVGNSATSSTGAAIGPFATTTSGGAVGQQAVSTTGFAGGDAALANGPGRVQLGTGTNGVNSTIQFLSSGSVTATQFGYLATTLSDVGGLAVTNGNFMVGDGSNWVAESGETALTSLGAITGSGGGNIGTSAAASTTGFAGGLSSSTASGAAVGNGTTSTTGGAVGDGATATTGFAGGATALANGTGRVQLGTGTNLTDSTIQFLSSGSVTATQFGYLADELSDIGGLTRTDGNIIVGDGSNWVAESGATARTSLGLAIGTDVQAYDAGLQSISGLTTAADKAIYTTASDTYATYDLTSMARTRAAKGGTTSVTATTYTTLITDDVILVDDDTAGADVTITLLAAATAGDGFQMTIKKLGTTGTVTLDGNGSETIDGELTLDILVQYNSVTLVCDGSNWYII